MDVQTNPSDASDSCLLARSSDTPAAARRFVCTVLEGWGVAENFTDVSLVTSELVTNAVIHAVSSVVVSIHLTPDRVRVEVSDLSPLRPVIRDPQSKRAGGWGLHIIERLATRWGLEPNAEGKTIWCEVARPAA